MKIIKSEIGKHNLHDYINHINRNDHKQIFVAAPGKNHYYLLTYLSFLFENQTIIELGTHHGTSALALSISKNTKIITYDVRDQFGIKPQPDNVERRLGNIFELGQQNILLESPLIFLDTSHTGEFEQQVYEFLKNNNYKGLLLLDDIHWNAPMKKFWNNIDTIKYDITDIGHGICPDGAAGTGIVDFSGELEII
jgi:tRNA A58 N-methylase Trm61